jgi:hypothetical protein
MPSSPGYKRDYTQEYKTAQARGENGTGHDSGNAERHRLRRKALKLGLVRKGQTLIIYMPSARAAPTRSPTLVLDRPTTTAATPVILTVR